jgi:hypothetical protein
MKTLKLVWLGVIQLFRPVYQLPQTMAKAGKQRQRQAIRNEREAERLDRICNPSRYRGK